jgi:hypothetical protein
LTTVHGFFLPAAIITIDQDAEGGGYTQWQDLKKLKRSPKFPIAL